MNTQNPAEHAQLIHPGRFDCPPPLTDLLMVHHGLATSTEMLTGHLPAGIGLNPLPGPTKPDLPWPTPPRFLHTYYPVNHVLLKAIIPGYRRYEYQHQRMVPGSVSGGFGRAAGFLANQVDIPPNTKQTGQELTSFSSFFFRFKPFDTDGARGMATLRLPNLRFVLQKLPYRLVPGSAQPQFIAEGDQVSTGLWMNQVTALYCKLSVPDVRAQPPAPPEFLPPVRHPIAQQDYRVVMVQQRRHLADRQMRESSDVRWRDLDSSGKLSFFYEAGVELLIEVGIFTSLLPTDAESFQAEGGVIFATRTEIEAVHVDTVRYA